MDKSLIINRIKDKKKIATDAELAKFLDVNYSTISTWRKRNSIDYDLIFAKCQDIDPTWLITGKESSYNEDVKSVLPPNFTNPKIKEPLIETQEVSIYDIQAAAGFVESIHDVKSLVPINSIKLAGMPKCDGGIYIYGDSMYPLIRNGDIVFYKEIVKDINSIIWGNIYLVSYYINGDHYLMCKYIQKSEKKGFISLLSYNKNHQPFEISFDDVLELALVKASFQRYFQ